MPLDKKNIVSLIFGIVLNKKVHVLYVFNTIKGRGDLMSICCYFLVFFNSLKLLVCFFPNFIIKRFYNVFSKTLGRFGRAF